MKFYLFLFFAFIQLSLFGQDTLASKEDSIRKQREIKAKQWFLEKQKYNHERCSQDSIRAVNDSKTQNKYFINTPAPSGDEFPAEEELKISLNKYNIIWGGTWMGSDIGGYSPNSCYNRYMTEFTEDKFGQVFIDDLVKQSILSYAVKNPTILFEHNDHLDWMYEGNYSIADKLLNECFFKKFNYPTNYKTSSKENDSFTEVGLELDENTNALKINGFKHHIVNNYNQQFIPYFEKRIRNFIESSNFTLSSRAALYNGTRTSFKIYYK